MELPKTARGNRYVIVMQDFLTKWPLVFPALDQKANQITRLLVDELLPMFGVPEALLSDRGPTFWLMWYKMSANYWVSQS